LNPTSRHNQLIKWLSNKSLFQKTPLLFKFNHLSFPLSLRPTEIISKWFFWVAPNRFGFVFWTTTWTLNEWINNFCSRMHMLSIWPRLFVGFSIWCRRFLLFILYFFWLFFLFFPILSHIRRKICRRHVYCARFENQLWPVDWLTDWVNEWQTDRVTDFCRGAVFIHSWFEPEMPTMWADNHRPAT